MRFWYTAQSDLEREVCKHGTLLLISVFPNIFYVCGTLTKYYIYLAAPLAKRFKYYGNETIGGTPKTSSQHPSVPRHPGWVFLP